MFLFSWILLTSQKLMVLMNPKNKEKEEEETVEEIGRMQTDVTDEDMAQR